MSVYSWKGKLQKDGEAMLVIKTRAALQDAVVRWVRAHHPYDVPETIFLPVLAGNPAYLAWVRDSTAAAAIAAPGEAAVGADGSVAPAAASGGAAGAGGTVP